MALVKYLPKSLMTFVARERF